MKKVYIILSLVLILSSSGVAVFLWSKKKEKAEKEKEDKDKTALDEEIVVEKEKENLLLFETPSTTVENSDYSIVEPISSLKQNGEIPQDLVSDIRIDYVSPNKLEMGYEMHYKGASHKGVFKHGDKPISLKKSLASFTVFTMLKKATGTDSKGSKGSKMNKGAAAVIKEGTSTELKVEEKPFVYLFILNNKNQAVQGLKVNLRTGDKIEGLPGDFPEFEGL
jgi:hypothetical protein